MLQSALGVPEVVNADNGEKGEGAVWDFSSLLKANALKPNETSASRKLIFRLSNVQPFKEGTVYKYGLVSLQARIFGKRKIP
jgi:hypothetical protein